jgi:hypothetical protein
MHVVHDIDTAPAVWDSRKQILGAACEPRQDIPRVMARPRIAPIHPAISGRSGAEELPAVGDADAKQVEGWLRGVLALRVSCYREVTRATPRTCHLANVCGQCG